MKIGEEITVRQLITKTNGDVTGGSYKHRTITGKVVQMLSKFVVVDLGKYKESFYYCDIIGMKKKNTEQPVRAGFHKVC